MSAIIKRKLSSHKKSIFAIILLTILFLFMILLFAVIGFDKKEDAVQFIGENKNNEYCYVDILALDSEYCASKRNGISTDYYYSAIDADNYWCIVVLKNSDIRKMKQQIENYELENPTLTYRLYGTSFDISNDLYDAYAEVYETDVDEIAYYFGSSYFDGKSSPSTTASIAFLAVAALIGVMIGFVCSAMLKLQKRNDAVYNAIALSGQQQGVEDDIRSAANQISNKNDYVLGEYCIVTKETIVPYNTIRKVCKHNIEDGNVVKNQEAYVFDFYNYRTVIQPVNKDFETFYGYLESKNPNIEFGTGNL